MRVSKTEADRSKERIVESASKLFRERGFEKVSVSEIMKDAGMTHGGFYRHFSSKDELMEEACNYAFDKTQASFSEMGLECALNQYLSESHMNNPATGCVIAALAGEVSRQHVSLQDCFSAGMKKQIDVLSDLLDQDRGGDCESRQKAILMFSTMIGALLMARSSKDIELSREILTTAINSLQKTQ
ncbi:TetR/AcrR family transcriptional regulator [Vibrio fluvialis]